MIEYILKLLTVTLIASIKYFWATPYSYGLKLNELETIFFMEIGGLAGFLFFYYFFDLLFKSLKRFWPIFNRYIPVIFKVRFEQWWYQQKVSATTARRFTHRNKIIVRLRRRYGIWGIVILSPVVLSIPLGALIGNKYFRHDKRFIPYMLISIGVWGVLSVSFFSLFMAH